MHDVVGTMLFLSDRESGILATGSAARVKAVNGVLALLS